MIEDSISIRSAPFRGKKYLNYITYIKLYLNTEIRYTFSPQKMQRIFLQFCC